MSDSGALHWLKTENTALKAELDELRAAARGVADQFGHSWFLEPPTEALVDVLSEVEAPPPAHVMSAEETFEWITALRRGDIDRANEIQQPA